MVSSNLEPAIIALLIVCSLCSCQIHCDDCTLSKKAQVILSTCNICQTGYVLTNNQCVIDVIILAAILVSGFVIIFTQLILVIFCKIKYHQMTKKHTQISLEDIYKQDTEEGEGNEEEKQSDSMKTQYKIYVKNKCGVCLDVKTSIKSACGHYFHHACFKDKIMQKIKDIKCPKCDKYGVSPIQMICSCCLNKKRQIPLQTITDYKYFNQYFCVTCKIKMRNEEQQKKWWKRCC